MKPSPLGYVRAASLVEAIDLLSDASADRRLLAGGQSLVPSLNLRLVDGVELIDINALDELKGIHETEQVLRIGALTRHGELGASALVERHAPLLHEAVPLIAHAAIRTRGTIGGSIANADPASELPACAVALRSTIVLSGPGGERRVRAEDFFHGLFETERADDEVLVAIEVPRIEEGDVQMIREIVRRSGDYALAGLAMAGRADAPRLVFFGVGEAPVIARHAMDVLASGGSVEKVVAALADDLDPPSDIHGSSQYRLHIAGVLLKRMLDECRLRNGVS